MELFNVKLNQIRTWMFIWSKQFLWIFNVGHLSFHCDGPTNIFLSFSSIRLDGPELEAGIQPTVNIRSEALTTIDLDCQIDGNPTPSYVWYEIPSNNATDMMPYYGQQNPYGQYPLRPQAPVPTAGLSVFGTTRKIQRLYQNPGTHGMLCQAQALGKTVKQEFIINVLRKCLWSCSNVRKPNRFISFSCNEWNEWWRTQWRKSREWVHFGSSSAFLNCLD